MIEALLLLAGAQTVGPPAPSSTTAFQVSQDQLDAITKECEVPRDWLKLVHGGYRARVQPGPKAPYDLIDCLIRNLRKRGIAMELGYAGSSQRLEPDAPKP